MKSYLLVPSVATTRCNSSSHGRVVMRGQTRSCLTHKPPTKYLSELTTKRQIAFSEYCRTASQPPSQPILTVGGCGWVGGGAGGAEVGKATQNKSCSNPINVCLKAENISDLFAINQLGQSIL